MNVYHLEESIAWIQHFILGHREVGEVWEVLVSVLLPWYILFLFFLSFLGPHQWHMEVPRLGV